MSVPTSGQAIPAALSGNNISLDHGYFFINPSLTKEQSISIGCYCI